jgi:hypothetical protein
MQIHEVQVFDVKRYEIDPERGAVLKHDQTIKRSGTDTIAFEGETYHIEPDGSFDVPSEVAAHYCARPGWYEGPNPFIEQIESESEAEKPAPKRRTRMAANAA